MKLSHLVPVSLLEWLPDEQTTHLVLSELILTNETYYEYYARRRDRGDRIILDNAIHEDRPVSLPFWLTAIEKIRPHIAVIPDVIDSDSETIDNAWMAVEMLKREDFTAPGLMAVPHGKTQGDWLECARKLAKLPEIAWFGLSLERRFNNDELALERRKERIKMLYHMSEFRRIKLHLLGISESGDELGEHAVWTRAASADTSKYVVWYLQGHPVAPPVPLYAKYPGRDLFGGSYDYFFANMPLGRSKGRLRRNLQYWTEYAERNDSA